MSIESFIKKIAVQTCVYWGSPVNNGYGKFTFAAPVELSPGVRWEEKIRIVSDSNGQQRVSDTTVLVTEDLDLNGYLYLGSLSGLTTGQKTDPMTLPGARQIIAFEKIPMIRSTTVFVRKIYAGR